MRLKTLQEIGLEYLDISKLPVRRRGRKKIGLTYLPIARKRLKFKELYANVKELNRILRQLGCYITISKEHAVGKILNEYNAAKIIKLKTEEPHEKI
jgi:hypothetical protein